MIMIVRLSFLCVTFSALVVADYEEFRGMKLCESRPSPQCCSSRVDECSVKIQGTRCYCDEFCDRGDRRDCCFDYLPYCKGVAPIVEPPKKCYFEGQFRDANDKWKNNCNDCECKFLGDVATGNMTVLCTTYQCLIDDRIINDVNRNERERGWRAGRIESFMGHRLEDGYERKTGTIFARNKVMSMLPKDIPVVKRDIPASFDARDQWPSYITPPQDQSWCANSWVWSTIGVASDRWGIQSNGLYAGLLSAQHLFSCNALNQKGCQGGFLTRAWKYIHKFGLVTEDCLPWTGDTPGRCSIPKRTSAKFARCPGSNKMEVLRRIGPLYRISGELQIMADIMANGPVQANMRVTRDFFVYKGGVYRCPEIGRKNAALTSKSQHSVRIIGWGETTEYGRREKYWIAANSWGREWGENGHFRIRRGTDECNIETFVLAMIVNSSPAVDPLRFNYNTSITLKTA